MTKMIAIAVVVAAVGSAASIGVKCDPNNPSERALLGRTAPTRDGGGSAHALRAGYWWKGEVATNGRI